MQVVHLHAAARLQPEDDVRPEFVRPAHVFAVVQDVDIPCADVAHGFGRAFIADAERVRAVRPELAVLHENVLAGGAAFLIHPLDGDVVVLTAQEAVADDRVRRVAKIHRVIVDHVRADDFHVVDQHVAAIVRHQRPAPGVADRNAFDFDVLSVHRMDGKRARPFETRIFRTIDDAAATDRDVVAARLDAAGQHGAARQIDRLPRLHVQPADFVKPRPEIQHIRIPFLRNIFLQWIAEQQQRLHAAVAFDGNPERLVRLEGNRVGGDFCRLDAETRGLDLHFVQRLGRRHRHRDLPFEIEGAEVVFSLPKLDVARIYVNRPFIHRHLVFARIRHAGGSGICHDRALRKRRAANRQQHLGRQRQQHRFAHKRLPGT